MKVDKIIAFMSQEEIEALPIIEQLHAEAGLINNAHQSYVAKAHSMPEKFTPFRAPVAKRTRPQLIASFIGSCSDDKLFYAKIDQWVANAPLEELAGHIDIGKELTEAVKTRSPDLILDAIRLNSGSGIPDFLCELTWITELHVWNGGFSELPELPCGLKMLSIVKCKNLKVLPRLPMGLKRLTVRSCALAELPMLPPSLSILELPDNKLREIRELPILISDLDLARNQLSTLPDIPYRLSRVKMPRNLFVHVPPALLETASSSVEWDFSNNPWSDHASDQITRKFRGISSYNC